MDDLVLVGVAQSLKHLASDPESVLKRLKTEVGLNTEVLRQNKERSVAFEFADGRELSATQALAEFQKLGGVEQVLVTELEESKTELPEEIKAAFANTSRTILSFRCQGNQRSFLVRVQRSPSTAFTFMNMVELVQAQPIRDRIWAALANVLNPQLEVRKQPLVDARELPKYFMDPRRESEHEYEKSSCLQEIQIECKLAQHPMIIPENLKVNLSLVQPAPQPEICFNYDAPLSGQDIIDLLEAQPNQELVQKRATFELADLKDEFKNPENWGEWKRIILSQNEETLKTQFGWKALSIVIGVCELTRSSPVIPGHLKPIFSPRKLVVSDDPRANLRARFYDEPYWSLKDNLVRWEVYGLCEMTNVKVNSELIEFTAAVQDFEKNLAQTRRFAERVESPFSEAFRYGQFLLTDSSLSTVGPSEEFFAKIQAALKAKQFSDIALNICNNTIWIVPFLTKMGFSSETVRALAAYDTIRSIFGGMGSWNDEVFSNEKDQAEYSACSSSLYQSLMKLFRAALNRS